MGDSDLDLLGRIADVVVDASLAEGGQHPRDAIDDARRILRIVADHVETMAHFDGEFITRELRACTNRGER